MPRPLIGGTPKPGSTTEQALAIALQAAEAAGKFRSVGESGGIEREAFATKRTRSGRRPRKHDVPCDHS
jgi:hypothetical protein